MATLHEKAQDERITALEAALEDIRAAQKRPSFTAPYLAQREDEEMRKLMQCVDKANHFVRFAFVAVVIVTLLQGLVACSTIAVTA